MSLTGTIRRPDGSPLGSVEEVKRRLSDTFPGVQFILEKEEPSGSTGARQRMSLLLRLWLAEFGQRVRYPHWNGMYQAYGGAIEFYFEVDEPVRWIKATSYGMTAGLDEYFDRLSTATGWKIEYPRY
jgi:hypothetical protein